MEEALERARGELKGMAVREEEAMETSSRVEQTSKEEMGKKASDDGSGCSRGEVWGDVEEVVGKDVEYVRSKEGRLFVVGKGVGGLVEGEKIQLDASSNRISKLGLHTFVVSSTAVTAGCQHQ